VGKATFTRLGRVPLRTELIETMLFVNFHSELLKSNLEFSQTSKNKRNLNKIDKIVNYIP
jgi:hypothetical protein